MIGTTRCANVNFRLEKRVLSRLNAQFVYIPPSSAKDICGALSQRLSLPSLFADQKDPKNQSQKGLQIQQSGRNFLHRFNSEVERSFGPIFEVFPCNTSNSSSSGDTQPGGAGDIDEDDNTDGNGKDNRKATGRKRVRDDAMGTLHDEIKIRVEDGCSLK